MVSVRYRKARTINLYVGFVAGVLLTIPAVILAILSGGGGHGNYLWAKLLFPYSMVIPVLCGTTISVPLIMIAIIQYPIYGVIVGIQASLKMRIAAMVLVLFVHASVAVICFSRSPGYFS